MKGLPQRFGLPSSSLGVSKEEGKLEEKAFIYPHKCSRHRHPYRRSIFQGLFAHGSGSP
jgi:hypothetical protein